MTRIVLIRSCSTDFDDEGRIKGTLDIPLNKNGNQQASEAAAEIADIDGEDIACVYFSPYQAAEQTAQIVGEKLGVKVRELKALENLDHGLWQGMLIEELREKQRKVYRQWQEQPETVCPPEGETVTETLVRVKTSLDKVIKKHKNQTVAIVAPEPLTSLIESYLQQSEIGDLWETICECGSWLVFDVEPQKLAEMAVTTNQA